MLNVVLYIPGGFLFTKVKESNVFKKLINLKSSKATGSDNIPEKFLKDSANCITPMVTHIFFWGGGGVLACPIINTIV